MKIATVKLISNFCNEVMKFGRRKEGIGLQPISVLPCSNPVCKGVKTRNSICLFAAQDKNHL